MPRQFNRHMWLNKIYILINRIINQEIILKNILINRVIKATVQYTCTIADLSIGLNISFIGQHGELK